MSKTPIIESYFTIKNIKMFYPLKTKKPQTTLLTLFSFLGDFKKTSV